MKNFKQVIAVASSQDLSKKPFYITDSKSHSYGNFVERIGKLNAFIRQQDLNPGDRIVVSISNDYDMFCITLCLILNGIVAVLIEPDAKSGRVEVILNKSQVKGCIVDKEKISEWKLENHQLAIGLEKEAEKKSMLLNKLLKKKDEGESKQTLAKLIESLNGTLDFPEIPIEQGAVIIFTSGTTSNPKGVVLSHKNLLSHFATLSNQYELDKDAVISNILPLYHVDGLFQGPFLSLYNQVTLSRPFHFEVQKIDELLHSIYKYKVTHFLSVPTMLALINQFGSDLHDSFQTDDFRFIISSAGYLDKSLWQSFMDNFSVRIVNVYGLTETVAGGLFCGPSDSTWKVGSIGKPIDMQVKLVDDESNTVEQGEIGEILVKGDNVLNSYLLASENPDQDGWFHTGDLAFQDEEGFYSIKGRKKNVIIKGGINVYPEQVIETLVLHKEIIEAYVYGEPDDIWGENVVATLVKQPASTITSQDIIQYCRDHLKQESIPDQIHFLESLPKGKSGKIVMEQVRAKVATIGNNHTTMTNASLRTNLLKIATECFGTTVTEDQINAPSQSIHGWNSLEHLHFASQIEKAYSIELSTKDIMNITSISSAISIVSAKKGNQ